MDRRSVDGPLIRYVAGALGKFPKCDTMEVDYGPWNDPRTVLHLRRFHLQRDPDYSPTPARTTQNQSKKVLPDVVTASHSDEKDTLIRSPTRSGSNSESNSVAGSGSGSATSSSAHEAVASFDEPSSSNGIHISQNDQPDPIEGEPNRWFVEGQWQIYRDTKMKNGKEKMARTITEERRVLTGSLYTMPDIHHLFQRHKCEWMAHDPSTYSEEIVREFNASYATTLRGRIHKNAKAATQDPLTSTMDDANVAEPHRGPRVDVPMGQDLIHTVEHMQGDGPPTTIPPDEHPTSSSQMASQAPSSSGATPLSRTTMIPLARVQKLEGQMATLLHHIKPGMRKLIDESEERVEKRMEAKTDQQVQAVHKRLDAFELRVLERPAPTTDMSFFRTELASLRADVDTILATPAVEP
uniref:Integrase core domain containing protein n=1 Tax=Solanum tuberosum TaxID=4113 RepID=M1DM43_SOLTU